MPSGVPEGSSYVYPLSLSDDHFMPSARIVAWAISASAVPAYKQRV